MEDREQRRAPEERSALDAPDADWLRAVFETAVIGVAIHDDGLVLEANRALAELFGYDDSSRLIGEHLIDDLSSPARPVDLHATGPTPFDGMRLDGSTFTAESTNQAIRYQGRPASIAFIRDLTDLIQAHGAVREADERFRAIVENVPAITYVRDSEALQGKAPASYVSPQIETLLGYSVDEWKADPRLWQELVHPDDVDRVIDHWNACLSSGERFRAEYRMRTRAGEELWVRDEAQPVGSKQDGSIRWQGTVYDITNEARQRLEILRREDQLAESEERFRSLVEGIPAITFIEEWIDPALPGAQEMGNPLRYLSPQFEEITGVPVDQRMGDPHFWHKHLHPDDRERIITADRVSSQDGSPLIEDYRMIFPDRDMVWLREGTRLIRDASGAPAFWLGVQFDITDHMQARERLTALHQIGNALITASPPRDVAEEALTRLRTVTGADRASVLEIDHATETATVLAVVSDEASEFVPGVRFPLPGILYPDEMLRGEAVFIDDLQTLAGTMPQIDRAIEEGIRSALSLPLVVDGALMGILTLACHTTRAFTDAHRRLAGEVSGPLALALHQAHLRELIERSAEELELRLSDLRHADGQRRDLLAQVVTAQEEERQRIASDIHDDSIQKLAAISLRLESLRSHIADDGESSAILDKIDETVQKAIGRLRHLMFELWPPALDRHGLGAAIRTELEQTRVATGLEYTLTDNSEAELSMDVRTIAYRIAQEAISNVRKHAAATSIGVSIDDAHDGLRIRITDDGRGIRPGAGSPPGHLGISAMRERAAMADGHVTIGPRTDGGTVVECWLPTPPLPLTSTEG